jgi:hypothetical protein
MSTANLVWNFECAKERFANAPDDYVYPEDFMRAVKDLQEAEQALLAVLDESSPIWWEIYHQLYWGDYVPLTNPVPCVVCGGARQHCGEIGYVCNGCGC